MFNNTETYWCNKGKYQTLHDELYVKLNIPLWGKADTPESELYRVAANIYYDAYNNGFCNDKWDEAEYLINNIDIDDDNWVLDNCKHCECVDLNVEMQEALENIIDKVLLFIQLSFNKSNS